MPGALKCDKCSYSIDDPTNFEKHTRTHTGEKPFKCTACPRSFADASNLKKHLDKHSGKTVKCNDCNQEFRSASLLTRHKQQKNQQHKCDHCCSSFKSTKSLSAHIRSKHSKDLDPSMAMAQQNISLAEEGAERDSYDPTQMPPPGSTKRPATLINPTVYDVPPKRTKPQIDHGAGHHAGMDNHPESDEGAGENEETLDNPHDASLFPDLDKGDDFAGSQDRVNSVAETQPDREGGHALADHGEQEGETNLEESDLEESDPEPEGNMAIGKLLFYLWEISKSFPTSSDKHSKEEFIAYNMVCAEDKGDHAVIAALENDLQKEIGMFPSCLVLVDHICSLGLPRLAQFHKTSLQAKLNAPFIQLVNHLTLFRLQKNITTVMPDNDLIRSLQPEMTSKLYLVDVFGNNIENRGGEAALTAMKEQVLQLLEEMIASTLSTNEYKILDSSFTLEERTTTWTQIVKAIDKNLDSYAPITINELIMLNAVGVGDGTDAILNVQVGSDIISLNLHKHVLNKFSIDGAEVEVEATPVVATAADIEAFKNFLYLNTEKQNRKGLITMGVFKLAEAAGITRVWEFLFGPKGTLQDLITAETTMDILKISMILKRQEDVVSVWQRFRSIFHYIISPSTHLSLLHGMDPDDIRFFFSCNCIGEEIVKYAMLLSWAYKKCDNPLPPFELVTYNPKVARFFDSVKYILKMSELKHCFHVIGRHCYVTFSDIANEPES